MKKLFLISLFCAVVLLQGCMAFLASQAGLAQAKAKYSRFYDDYKFEQEKINNDRMQNSLPPVPVKEYDTWLKEQPLSNNEIKVFKMYGVISPDEARDIKEREMLK